MNSIAPTIRLAALPADFPAIQTIRYQVFQLEQGVSAELEFDGQDSAATHWLANWQGQPVGTARVRSLSATTVKIERVAVLRPFRGLGIGQMLMQAMLDWLTETGQTEARIHAQTAVQAFYERLGFAPEGEVFTEAGIPHVKMKMLLNKLG
jgi:predicted GNAT family N-acyltransferase